MKVHTFIVIVKSKEGMTLHPFVGTYREAIKHGKKLNPKAKVTAY